MTIYTLNDEGRRQVAEFIRANARAEVVEYLDKGGLDAWCNDAEESLNNGWTQDGHIEIRGLHSKTRNPITATFDRNTCFEAEEINEED